jgi:hypothetical protein
MGLDDDFGADSNLQQNGTWVDYGDYSILVAYSGDGNDRFEKTMERRMRPFRRYLDSKNVKTPDSVKKDMEKAFAAVYAHAVVLDWRGVKRGGVEIPFSAEAALKAFVELPAFFANIRDFAGELANFQADVLEEDSKNS